MIAPDASTGRLQIALVLLATLAATVITATVVGLLPLQDAGVVPLAAAAALAALVIVGRRPRLVLVFGVVLYVAGFEWAYVSWVVPIFAYSGLIDVGVDQAAYLVVTVLAALPAVWLPVRLERPSAVVIWFLYLFAYVPATVVPIRLLGPALTNVLPLEVLLVIAFAILGLVGRLPPIPASIPAVPARWFGLAFVIVGVLAIPYLLLVFGVSAPPALQDIYDRRATYQTVLNSSAGSGYVATWLGNIVYPFLLALGLARRRLGLLLLGIAGQLLIYSISGLKEMLLSVIFVPLLYATIRRGSANFGPLVAWGGVAIIAVSVVAEGMGSDLALSLFLARMIAIPGQLTAYYFDFFTSHDPYLLLHSVLHWFGSPPYALEPPFLIGRVYLHVVVDANANIWADSMANFGLVGVIPVTIALAIVLWILDSVAVDRDLAVIGSVLGLAGLVLANGPLLTSLLTAGVGLMILVIAVMPRGVIGSVADARRDEPGAHAVDERLLRATRYRGFAG